MSVPLVNAIRLIQKYKNQDWYTVHVHRFDTSFGYRNEEQNGNRHLSRNKSDAKKRHVTPNIFMYSSPIIFLFIFCNFGLDALNTIKK